MYFYLPFHAIFSLNRLTAYSCVMYSGTQLCPHPAGHCLFVLNHSSMCSRWPPWEQTWHQMNMPSTGSWHILHLAYVLLQFVHLEPWHFASALRQYGQTILTKLLNSFLSSSYLISGLYLISASLVFPKLANFASSVVLWWNYSCCNIS